MAILTRRLQLLTHLERLTMNGLGRVSSPETRSPRSEGSSEKTPTGMTTSTRSEQATAFDFEAYVEQWEAEGRPYRGRYW